MYFDLGLKTFCLIFHLITLFKCKGTPGSVSWAATLHAPLLLKSLNSGSVFQLLFLLDAHRGTGLSAAMVLFTLFSELPGASLHRAADAFPWWMRDLWAPSLRQGRALCKASILPRQHGQAAPPKCHRFCQGSCNEVGMCHKAVLRLS